MSGRLSSTTTLPPSSISMLAFVVAPQVGRGIKVAHRTAFFENKFRTPQFTDLESVHGDRFLGDRVVPLLAKFDDLVFVPGESKLRVPIPVFPLVVVSQACLDTRIAHVAGLNIDVRVAGRCGQIRIESLVIGVGAIPRCRECESMQEPGVET